MVVTNIGKRNALVCMRHNFGHALVMQKSILSQNSTPDWKRALSNLPTFNFLRFIIFRNSKQFLLLSLCCISLDLSIYLFILPYLSYNVYVSLAYSRLTAYELTDILRIV